MTEYHRVGAHLPPGVPQPLQVVLDAPGVAVKQKDPLAAQLDELLWLIHVAPVAVAGHRGHGGSGELLLQLFRVPDAVAQVQDMIRLHLLRAADHILHAAVGVG